MSDNFMTKHIKIKMSPDSTKELDYVLSAILCDTDNNLDLVRKVLTLVSQEECEQFYFVIHELLRRMERTQINTSVSKIEITEDMFKSFLLINIERFIKNSDVNIQAVLGEVQETAVLDTYEGLIKTKNIFYTYSMNKFKELKAMNISIVEGTLRLDNLYQSIINDYSIQSVRLGAMCLEDVVYLGNREFSGADGYFELVNYTKAKIESKKSIWSSIESTVDVLDSIESYNKMKSEDKIDFSVTGTFGFPPIDDFAEVCRSDIINICATEGTGKTNYCAGFACREIMNGYSVIFMCGESGLTKITDMILSHYIYLTTGYEISQREISGDISKLPEEWKAVINKCRWEFFNNPNYGKLFPVDRFSYNNYRDEVKRKINAHPDLKFGHVIIDHYGSLTIDNEQGGVYLKDIYSAAAYLTNQMVALKIDTGCGTLFTSHTSRDAEDMLNRGKNPGTRVGALSSGSSKDVDTLILMYSDEDMRKQSLVKVWVKKIRAVEESLFQPFVAKKHFVVANFIYSPELQENFLSDDDKELALEDMEIEDLIE